MISRRTTSRVMSRIAVCSSVNVVIRFEAYTGAWHLRRICTPFALRLGYKRRAMSAPAVPVRRDLRVISLIGVAHGSSHYYQLAFVTMLLIVRERVGLNIEEVGFLGALFYAVSGFGQTAAGFAVDRFGARPILAGGLLALGIMMGSFAV